MPQQISTHNSWADVPWIRERLQEGLELLCLANRYASLGGSTIERFAVKYSALSERGLAECDLRWLLSQAYLEHFLELTLPGDLARSFRAGGAAICSESCFMLTGEGLAFAEWLTADLSRSGAPFPPNAKPERNSLRTGVDMTSPTRLSPLRGGPVEGPEDLGVISPSLQEEECHCPAWDSDRQELWFLSKLVKRFRLPCPNQAAVLSAFEEDGWPARIDDPLPPKIDQSPKRRLHDTIRNLNRSHRHPVLRFVGDGSGQGVLWEPLA